MKLKKALKQKEKEFDGFNKYEKLTGGTHIHFDGQKVEKGEFLYLPPDYDLPKAFAKDFNLVRKAKETVKTSITIVPSFKKHRFDVINKEGAKLNEEPLNKKDAVDFVEALEKEENNEE